MAVDVADDDATVVGDGVAVTGAPGPVRVSAGVWCDACGPSLPSENAREVVDGSSVSSRGDTTMGAARAGRASANARRETKMREARRAIGAMGMVSVG